MRKHRQLYCPWIYHICSTSHHEAVHVPHGQGVQTAKTSTPLSDNGNLFHKATVVGYDAPDCGSKRNFPSFCAYFLLILTFRVHWSLPSGRGMSCGNRRGNSNSPSDAKGDCRCRFSRWMVMLSCLATCRRSGQVMGKLKFRGATWGIQSFKGTSETISSFVTGVRSSFPVEMNLLNTYQYQR